MPVNYSALAAAALSRGHGSANGSDVSSFDLRDISFPAGEAAHYALELLGYEMILADAAACGRHAGRSADAAGSAIAIAIRSGRLLASNELDSKRLEAAIRTAIESRSSGLHPVRMAAGPDVLVARLPGKALALVLARRAPGPASGRDGFVELTGAEQRLLHALARGERLARYAERSGIKLTTAKTHLQSLFGKTGQRRQADLIRWAMSIGWSADGADR